MKIENLRVLDVETAGEIRTIEAGIDVRSLPFVFEILSKSFYSNPVGSIIREITSNCVDSHTEAGVTEPVVIKKTFDIENDEFYINFIDYGVGLSPERVENIYMNYFSSSKREDNTQIGGFGLGSKSPLSYQDLFYIITCYDGIEYEYLFHRGETKPTLSLLTTKETLDHNGTTVKVAIKKNDENLFTSNIRKQLTYFDNVYVAGFGINNVYQILEAKTFKYRDTINVHNEYTEMHIVFDKVVYPIDWKAIGMGVIRIPVGVKFGIGELEITPNREAIRYTEKMRKLIPEKIKACLEELGEKYSQQKRETSDLFEFMRVRGEQKILHLLPGVSIFLNNDFFNNYKWTYTPLAHLPIKMPEDPFYMYDGAFTISGGRTSNTYHSPADILKRYTYVYYTESPARSEYTNLYLSNATVIKRVKRIPWDHAHALGLNFFKKKSTYYEEYKLGRQKFTEIIPNKPRIIKEYVDHIVGIVRSIALDYQKVEVPQSFINDYKQSLIRADYAAKRKAEEKILVKYVGYSGKDEVKLADLAKIPVVVYGLREDEATVGSWQNIIQWNTKLKNNYKIVFFTIAGCYHNQIQRLENCVYIHDFVGSERFRRMIKNIATNWKISGRWYYQYLELIELFAPPDIAEMAKELRSKENSYKYSTTQVNMLIHEAEKYGCYNQLTLLKLSKLDKYFNGLEVLMYVKGNVPLELGAKLLKPFKKRLKTKFYNIKQTTQWPSLKTKLLAQEQEMLSISWLTE